MAIDVTGNTSTAPAAATPRKKPRYRKKVEEILGESTGAPPEPMDSSGNRIYGNTQFGTGPNTAVSRIYPNLPQGGYSMSYDQVAKALGYGDNAGVWLGAGGGVMGRGTEGKLSSYRSRIAEDIKRAEEEAKAAREAERNKAMDYGAGRMFY